MHKRKITGIIFLIIIFQIIIAGCQSSEVTTTADAYLVMYAFDAEGKLLAEMMEITRTDHKLGKEIQLGTIAGKEVILAESGVGMTNAAMTTQSLIDTYNPQAVLFSGIAGGIDSTVHIGDIVAPDSWIQHDYGYIGPDGFVHYPLDTYSPDADSVIEVASFPADSAMLAALNAVPVDSVSLKPIGERRPALIVGGVGVTGDTFIDSREKRQQLFENFGALTTDMESAAVAQVCFTNGKPFIILRSASDLAGGTESGSARQQIKQFFEVAAHNSASILVALLGRL